MARSGAVLGRPPSIGTTGITCGGIIITCGGINVVCVVCQGGFSQLNPRGYHRWERLNIPVR